MTRYSHYFSATVILSIFLNLSAKAQNKMSVEGGKSKALHDAIVHMDSIYFNAYNSCDMEKQAAIYADSIEFYHDSGGLETSKTKLLASIKQNICGKVSRQLVPGSIDVYPLPGFGAVEIGMHQFINHAEGNSVSKPDRFIIIWRNRNNSWQITRVISLHAGSRGN